MGFITYNLNNASLLGGMVPIPGGVAALPVGLAGAGIYMIANANTNNRYVGKSGNLTTRFNKRLESVCEMGFSTAQLNQISVYWGTITSANTPGIGIMPFHIGVPAGGYSGGAALNAVVDGVAVECERLFVRFVMTQFVGGFVTNNHWAAIGATYTNPTPNPITVTFNWGAGGYYAAGNHTAVWGVGAAW